MHLVKLNGLEKPSIFHLFQPPLLQYQINSEEQTYTDLKNGPPLPLKVNLVLCVLSNFFITAFKLPAFRFSCEIMSSLFTLNNPVIISALRAGSSSGPAHQGPHSVIQRLSRNYFFSYNNLFLTSNTYMMIF